MRTLTALVAAIALCAGCAGSLLESRNEAPEVYRLASPERADRGDPLPLALSVARPRAASSLDSERIAVLQPDRRFDYFSGVRWSDPAPQMLQQMLVGALAADGRFATIVAAPSRVPADLALDVELRRFEAVYAAHGAPPQVRVEMQVTLVDSRKSRRVTSFVVRTDSAAVADRRGAVLEAFERATEAALAETVAGVRAVPFGPQP